MIQFFKQTAWATAVAAMAVTSQAQAAEPASTDLAEQVAVAIAAAEQHEAAGDYDAAQVKAAEAAELLAAATEVVAVDAEETDAVAEATIFTADESDRSDRRRRARSTDKKDSDKKDADKKDGDKKDGEKDADKKDGDDRAARFAEMRKKAEEFREKVRKLKAEGKDEEAEKLIRSARERFANMMRERMEAGRQGPGADRRPGPPHGDRRGAEPHRRHGPPQFGGRGPGGPPHADRRGGPHRGGPPHFGRPGGPAGGHHFAQMSKQMHLRLAAAHLKAAGMEEAAKRVYAMGRAEAEKGDGDKRADARRGHHGPHRGQWHHGHWNRGDHHRGHGRSDASRDGKSRDKSKCDKSKCDKDKCDKDKGGKSKGGKSKSDKKPKEAGSPSDRT